MSACECNGIDCNAWLSALSACRGRGLVNFRQYEYKWVKLSTGFADVYAVTL